MKNLTPNNIESLIGKTIRWEAPIYHNNIGHWGEGLDGGICVLKSVDPTERKPILESEVLEGTDPKYIFNEYLRRGEALVSLNDNPFCFSDEDRYVSFELV